MASYGLIAAAVYCVVGKLVRAGLGMKEGRKKKKKKNIILMVVSLSFYPAHVGA